MVKFIEKQNYLRSEGCESAFYRSIQVPPQIHLLFFQLTQITLVLERQMWSSKMKIWRHSINERNKEMEMFYMKM